MYKGHYVIEDKLDVIGSDKRKIPNSFIFFYFSKVTYCPVLWIDPDSDPDP
jgi:hypothetical protein